VYLDFIYQPIRGVDGEVTGIFVSGHDVTPRVVASEQQRDDDRRKDEFLAMLGHELRNPLAAIQNASELLTYGLETRAQTREVGELLARQVAHLGRLVDDLLDVSRITQGRIELKREHVELGSAIRDAIETVQPLIVAKDHKVVTTASAEPLYVDADRARIVQALANVLANAAKYTGPRGVIRVRWRREGPAAVIEIEDNGMGIPPMLLPRVFDLFVQGDRSADRSQGGLGIGLSVVRRLVEMHGGVVTAASEGVAGQGSTFTIRMPLLDIAGEKEASLPRGNSDSQRVLVVDDNVDAADSLVILLNMSGHETKAAYDGSQAIELARAFAPNVVLLDIGLPGMDGYETAARLRAEHGGIAIVAVTGYGSAADVERARSAGFDAHITKPVAFDELKAVLAEVAI
jgi:CheY-like chemotaxis protein/nitrogen-specific signal transduction histidine kinase